ncbi:Ligand dependent nuclear receptor [Homalodisca vitripennis]|nr:Ligand dependent nuclear receptor [Homalodisca vitripennis]
MSHEENYSMEAKDWEPSDKCNLCHKQKSPVSVWVSGLERVAEELMGRRKWRQYQKLVLSHEEDYSMEAKDWEPSDKCNLCPEHGDQPPPPHTDTSLPVTEPVHLSLIGPTLCRLLSAGFHRHWIWLATLKLKDGENSSTLMVPFQTD